MIKDVLKDLIEKKNTLMFIASVSFILGIASFYSGKELVIAIFFTIVLCFVAFRRWVSFKVILVWAFVFYIGFFNAYFRIKNTDDLVKLAPSNVEVIGRITSIPNSNISNKTKFFFDVESVNSQHVKAKTFVNIANFDNDFGMFKVGQMYKISGKLRHPLHSTNPSQFDYSSYLRNFGVFSVLYAEKADCLFLEAQLPLKWQFMKELNDFRNGIIDVHAKYLKSPKLEILGGIVFGDDAVAPPDYIKDNFVNSGLLHILAASGMNVAFIFGFWFYILTLCKVPYRLRVISGIGMIILYVLMTGMGASVVRAALMLVFVLLGKLIDRDAHSVALLSFVAFLMLLYNPAYLNDVGFQLSFVVTLGLLCSANVCIEKFKGNKVKEILAGVIIVPVVAQIWVIPIQLFYFNTISLYSFFANVSVVPFLSIVSFGGFVSSVFAKLPFVGDFICRIFDVVLNLLLTVIVAISEFFAQLPGSLLELAQPSLFSIFIYYLVVLLITLLIKKGFEKCSAVILSSLIIVLISCFISLPHRDFEMIMFDVGNADAFLLKTPLGKYILIDSGKLPFANGKSQAEMIVRNYLKDKGVKNLEIFVLSHFDSDHSGGAETIMNKMKVANLLVNSVDNQSPLAKKVYKIAKDRNVNIQKAQNDDVIYSEKDFIVKTYQHDFNSDNESSVILLVSYKEFDVLFTGDAGVEALEVVKPFISKKVEVLKVGHHGASNVVNKDILDKFEPDVSLVSVGVNNYGHPDKDTISVLENTDIFRTDKVGAVKIVSGGESYTVYKYSGVKKDFDYVFTRAVKQNITP